MSKGKMGGRERLWHQMLQEKRDVHLMQNETLKMNYELFLRSWNTPFLKLRVLEEPRHLPKIDFRCSSLNTTCDLVASPKSDGKKRKRGRPRLDNSNAIRKETNEKLRQNKPKPRKIIKLSDNPENKVKQHGTKRKRGRPRLDNSNAIRKETNEKLRQNKPKPRKIIKLSDIPENKIKQHGKKRKRGSPRLDNSNAIRKKTNEKIGQNKPKPRKIMKLLEIPENKVKQQGKKRKRGRPRSDNSNVISKKTNEKLRQNEPKPRKILKLSEIPENKVKQHFTNQCHIALSSSRPTKLGTINEKDKNAHSPPEALNLKANRKESTHQSYPNTELSYKLALRSQKQKNNDIDKNCNVSNISTQGMPLLDGNENPFVEHDKVVHVEAVLPNLLMGKVQENKSPQEFSEVEPYLRSIGNTATNCIEVKLVDTMHFSNNTTEVDKTPLELEGDLNDSISSGEQLSEDSNDLGDTPKVHVYGESNHISSTSKSDTHLSKMVKGDALEKMPQFLPNTETPQKTTGQHAQNLPIETNINGAQPVNKTYNQQQVNNNQKRDLNLRVTSVQPLDLGWQNGHFTSSTPKPIYSTAIPLNNNNSHQQPRPDFPIIDEYHRLFGIKCFRFLENDCSNIISCKHNFASQSNVLRGLSRLNELKLLAVYRCVLQCSVLFQKYFFHFANLFGKRKMSNCLIQMTVDCLLHKNHCAPVFKHILSGLKQCGMVQEAAISVLMNHVWLPVYADKYPKMMNELLKLLASANWQDYIMELRDLFNNHHYPVPFNFIVKLARKVMEDGNVAVIKNALVMCLFLNMQNNEHAISTALGILHSKYTVFFNLED